MPGSRFAVRVREGDDVSEPGVGGRTPETSWEFAVSAADQLVLWCADGSPELGEDPLRTRTVVLLAAALHDRAQDAGLEGPSVIAVPLARVLDALKRHAASALEACPAPAGAGGEVRDWLLARYATADFDQVARAAQDVVEQHLAAHDVTTDGVSIDDRRPALRERARRRQHETLAAFEDEDY